MLTALQIAPAGPIVSTLTYR